MGTGDYICVVMTGGAPWGFRLQGGTGLQEPLNVSKVRSMSKASIAGLCVGDEVVSINGKLCNDIPYAEVVQLIEKATDNLQMLVKRTMSKTLVPQNRNGDGEFVNRDEYTESSTLEIRPAMESTPRTLNIPEKQNHSILMRTEGSTALTNKDVNVIPKITHNVIEIPKTCVTGEIPLVGRGEQARQGAMVELHLSLSPDMQLGPGTPIVTVLGAEKAKSSEIKHSEQPGGSVPVTEVCLSQREPPVQQSSTTFQIVGRPQTKIIPVAEANDPSFPRVELILDCSGREEPRSLSDRGCAISGEEGGQSEAPPSAVSFGITAEDSEQGEEDQQAERDHTRPNKHRARHAKLRRSESLSEKQVKEAKSKCKTIALLLTAAPNPRSKGVLMFKKRRQRARKYTLISYGTGELERQEDDNDDDENEDEEDKENTFKVTFYGASDSDLDEDFFSDPENEAQVVTFDWDTGLVEVEKKLKSGEAMEELPETKGKGVLMFARRKQRMEQITAEQEEVRKHIMEEKVSMTEINNGVAYNDQQRETIKTQSCVSKSYIEVSHGRVQNGIAGVHELNSPFSMPENSGLNASAKPFGVNQNRAALPFSSSRNITSPVSDVHAPPPYSSVTPPPEPMYHVSSPVASKVQAAVWSPTYPNEQIASRDERIAVPANRTGILQETKRRSAKPMFTFKEQPKVSPNPELLSLVQDRESKRSTGAGNESGPEEDYLSLGAEACNFMQAQKQKTPPPVAPKPSVRSPTTMTPVSPVWIPPSVATAPPQVFPSQNIAQSTSPPQVIVPQPTTQSYNPPTTLNLAGPNRGPSTVAASANQTCAPKTPLTPTHGSAAVAGGVGPAYEMPALRGKGAELFAKRQSRMEKYVVDSATVQAHAARPISPTPSLPSSWKYSSNVRAPPPLAYNPIQSPLYPPAANKSSSKPGSSVSKNTKKKPTKALSPLEVMKHQPYQLNSSLFTFQPPSESAPSTAVTKQNFKSDSLPPVRQAQSMKPVNVASNANFHTAAPVYPQSSNNVEPSFQTSVFTPAESCSTMGYPMYPRQESPVGALIPPPRPKFSAKKAGVAAQERDNIRSMSFPGRSFSYGCIQPLASPSSPLLFEPSPGYASRPSSTPDTPGKKLTPWEAAAKSPLGLVDDAFMLQDIHESISANIVSAARRKTLPGPPAAWKSTSKTPPGPTSYSYGGLQGEKTSGVASFPKSVVSPPSFQCSYQLRHPYSSQSSITSPNNVPLCTRSEYCMSVTQNTNHNTHPRPWRR
ncbi:synaptopodin-2 [Pelobates cultripes]|uniref:Synaptopodin-2 n=1 Tax=Pelobates cultripes TaxID=61616 RepID=A0AAD1SKS8_PELCU|nr:synaptopodin-2 [Pelobates cultripes]